MIPSISNRTLWCYATLCKPSKRRGASIQGGHHLHTYTTSFPRGFPNGNGSHISQHSRVICCAQWYMWVHLKTYILEDTKETHWTHKYPWNLAAGYTIFQRLDIKQHQYVDLLHSAPKHRYSPQAVIQKKNESWSN